MATIVYLSNQMVQAVEMKSNGCVLVYEELAPEGSIINGIVTDEEVFGDFLKHFFAAGKFSKKDCTLVLNSTQITTRVLELPRAGYNDLNNMMLHEFGDSRTENMLIVSFPMRLDHTSRMVKFLASSVNKNYIESYVKLFAQAGIEVCAGASGDTDKAVEDYLNGNLVDAGMTCNHHGEGHTCGHHDEGHTCGHHSENEEHNCGCGSQDGAHEKNGCGCKKTGAIEGPNVGKTLRVHYTGTFNDGTKFDSSYDRGEPLEFVCGAGMMIKGFDRAVADMEVGQIVDVHLMPEEAYGLPDPDAIFNVEISQLPGAEELEVGQQVYLQNAMGQPFPVIVAAKEAGIITFDANHEMAGKELNFKIELVEIR